MDTIPEESRTRPSGIRSLSPGGGQEIPQEINRLISRVLDGEIKSVDVMGLSDEPFMVTSSFLFVTSRYAPAVDISTLAYTDGTITASTVDEMCPTSGEVLADARMNAKTTPRGNEKAEEPKPAKLIYAVTTTIDGANFIAVVNHKTKNENHRRNVVNSLTIYAQNPRSLQDHIRALKYTRK